MSRGRWARARFGPPPPPGREARAPHEGAPDRARGAKAQDTHCGPQASMATWAPARVERSGSLVGNALQMAGAQSATGSREIARVGTGGEMCHNDVWCDASPQGLRRPLERIPDAISPTL